MNTMKKLALLGSILSIGAAYGMESQVVEVEKKQKESMDALMSAIRSGDAKTVKGLLESGVDLNQAFDAAIDYTHYRTILQIDWKRLDYGKIVYDLLERRAGPLPFMDQEEGYRVDYKSIICILIEHPEVGPLPYRDKDDQVLEVERQLIGTVIEAEAGNVIPLSLDTVLSVIEDEAGKVIPLSLDTVLSVIKDEADQNSAGTSVPEEDDNLNG